jgi:hypothetical protein
LHEWQKLAAASGIGEPMAYLHASCLPDLPMNPKRTTLVCALALALAAAPTCALAGEPPLRDLFSDTWVGRDALGRTMPVSSDVGPVKKDHRRVVAIFYITWHSDSLHNLKAPYRADVSRILAENPEARLDAKHPLWTEGSYHWGEPEMGYFLSKDEYVIRKDMSMLSDAGVDVLVMDVTNAVRYWDEWETVFAVMEKMRAEGNPTPRFCFWAFNGPVITVVQDLYDRIYKAGKYKDLWFLWDGKPLLLYNAKPQVDANGKAPQNPNPHYEPGAKTDPTHPHYGDPDFNQEFYRDYSREVKNFFTLRGMWWGYWEWAGERYVGTEDHWSFGLDLGDKHVAALSSAALISPHNGKKEESAVTPGQHPSSLIGKSWTRGQGEPELNEHDLPEATHVPWLGAKTEHPEGYGIYFQQRWDEALQGDPEFLYLNDWNEWTAGKYSPAGGGTTGFMRRDSTYFFVDQYNAEFNRTIQPMKDGYTDNYYMQMAENIRRYKGVRPIPKIIGTHRIKVDGAFDDWTVVDTEYRDPVGDTFHRNYDGYGGLHFTNNTGRNDIIKSKIAFDRSTVYFYVETNERMSPHTGTNWMLLLLDTDQNSKTGWYGYDYLINWKVVDAKTTTLSRYEPNRPGDPWVEVGRLPYRYGGKAMEIAVPRRWLGLKGNAFSFDFHWCDNPFELKDPISLCISGDSAPNRRFNYRCIFSQTP